MDEKLSPRKGKPPVSKYLSSPAPGENIESGASVNVKLSQSGPPVMGGNIGMSRPSSPGHSPAISPSQKQKYVSSYSPRSGSPMEASKAKDVVAQAQPQPQPQPKPKPVLEEMPKRAVTPPLRSPARAFSLAASLKVPRSPVALRLSVSSPGTPEVEGKYLLSRLEAKVPQWVGENGLIAYNEEDRIWEITKECDGTVVVRSEEVMDPKEGIAGVGGWKSVDGGVEAKVVLLEERCDTPVVNDFQGFEEVLTLGVADLEDHIFQSLKSGYGDNVGSMYRLPRRTATSPGETRTFEIDSYFRYLYEPTGLGWSDGRPAVLAALIYTDRIRAHGRIISRRTVHRLLTAAVLIGHEYFMGFMKETADTEVEPAPVHTLCEMIDMTPELMEPLVMRFKGMMDFETAVIEQDVSTYVGGLNGGIEINEELKELAKSERVPGQQGLSSRRDGMDAIRSWVEETVACTTTLTAAVVPAKTIARKIGLHNLGGSASRSAVGALLRVHRGGAFGGVTRLQSPIPVINHSRNISPNHPSSPANPTKDPRRSVAK